MGVTLRIMEILFNFILTYENLLFRSFLILFIGLFLFKWSLNFSLNLVLWLLWLFFLLFEWTGDWFLVLNFFRSVWIIWGHAAILIITKLRILNLIRSLIKKLISLNRDESCYYDQSYPSVQLLSALIVHNFFCSST